MLSKEDIEQFQTHRAIAKDSQPKKQTQNRYEAVFKACEHQKSVLLHAAMDQNIKKLLALVRSNELPSEYSSKAKIYPIILKENQVEHLSIFIEKLTKQVQKHEEQIFGRSHQEILVKSKSGSDVREILLEIYDDGVQLDGKPDFKFYVYIINEVTDLSEDNLYLFSKGITNKNFVVFLPTFSTFEEDVYEAVNKFQMEKFMTTIYDSRSLFAKYVYICIVKPNIKAYLPKEILDLITDMDYYNLGYSQSCRRFNYCLLKALQLNLPQPKEVNSSIIQKIENILSKKFFVKEHITNWFNIIKVILTEQQTYKISHSALSVELALSNLRFDQNLDQSQEDIFIQQLRMSFCKNLDKNEVAIFQPAEESLQNKPKTTRVHKKTRMQLLLIETKVAHTKKMKLENSIARLIKALTKEVRRHAKSIKWSYIKFTERIKPCIPIKLVDTMRKEELQVVQLVEAITSYHSRPLSSLLSLFDEENLGYGLYLIKTLELSGILSLSRKEVNPIVFNNFYQKAKFN